MPHIKSKVRLADAWYTFMTNNGPKTVPQLIADLMYDSYACQRDYGMSHEDCMIIGLGRPEYNERYNQENIK